MSNHGVQARSRKTRRAAELLDDANLVSIHEFTELVVASARSSAQRDRRLRAAGAPVTGASMTALRLIQRYGPVAASDVARRLGLDLSTTSRQVRPLEEHGLVARTADPDDRRVAWLKVTAKGERLLQRVRDVALNDYDAALARWSKDDRHKLAELLDRFRRDLLVARVDESGWAAPVGGRTTDESGD